MFASTLLMIVVALVMLPQQVNGQCMMLTCEECARAPECAWCRGGDTCIPNNTITINRVVNPAAAVCLTTREGFSGIELMFFGTYNASQCPSLIRSPRCMQPNVRNSCTACKLNNTECGYCKYPGIVNGCRRVGSNLMCVDTDTGGAIGTYWADDDELCDLTAGIDGVDPCTVHTNCSSCSLAANCGWCLVEGASFSHLSSCWTRGTDQGRSCTAKNGAGGFWLVGTCTKPTPTPSSDTNTDGLLGESSPVDGGTIAAAILVPLIVLIACCVGVAVVVMWRRQMFWFSSREKQTQAQDKQKSIEAPVLPGSSATIAASKDEEKLTDYQPIAQTDLQKVVNSNLAAGNLSSEIDFHGWEIPSAELEMGDEIGRGAYGVVYRAKWRGTPVAVKQILSDRMTPKDMRDFVAEISLMKVLRAHDNVVLLMGICASPLSVVTEYLEKGSLLSYLNKNLDMSMEQKLKVVRGMARGMLHLHLENIVHRDLAARNVLLTAALEPKISDFGMSRVNLQEEDANKTNTGVGPLKWMAPESIRDNKYSLKSDVWAFGIVITEILTHDKPYGSMQALQVATLVGQQKLRPSCPEGSPQIFVDLVFHCSAFEPNERPSFQDICEALSQRGLE